MSKKSTALWGAAAHVLTIGQQKGLTEAAGEDLSQTGFLSDLFEAAVAGNLKTADRETFRHILGLSLLNPPAVKTVWEIDSPVTEEFDLHTFFSTDNPTIKFVWVDADLKRYFKTQLIPAEGSRRLVVSELVRNVTEKELLAVGQKTTEPTSFSLVTAKSTWTGTTTAGSSVSLLCSGRTCGVGAVSSSLAISVLLL